MDERIMEGWLDGGLVNGVMYRWRVGECVDRWVGG